ncbi:hypothetical protein PIB19_02005 [Sphingomonas sp. 7/4-4]|uniref:hypothetical protein n=1 Tax=Sphingomonas sp. 7/4-4 TaxID=3018446 RepID=UPI0022F3ED0A|nr:hypothetical protein [Sphingomonas sp. 7/4-4]WBY08324.1 hypothetical protein PIB19_02005 [Sphingomonas sp. 7/4-4]
MTLIDLTYLIIQLNAAIDSGEKAEFKEIKQHIRDGDVFQWLKSNGFSVDVSLVTGERNSVGAEIVDELQSILEGYDGSERRKWGIENNGLNLLLAWVNEIIQLRFGKL